MSFVIASHSSCITLSIRLTTMVKVAPTPHHIIHRVTHITCMHTTRRAQVIGHHHRCRLLLGHLLLLVELFVPFFRDLDSTRVRVVQNCPKRGTVLLDTRAEITTKQHAHTLRQKSTLQTKGKLPTQGRTGFGNDYGGWDS